MSDDEQVVENEVMGDDGDEDDETRDQQDEPTQEEDDYEISKSESRGNDEPDYDDGGDDQQEQSYEVQPEQSHFQDEEEDQQEQSNPQDEVAFDEEQDSDEKVPIGEFEGEAEELHNAATKIQKIHRGVRDRAKIRNMKAEGSLPAQQRPSIPKPVTIREPVKSQGELTFYDGIGSHYVGELLDGLPHGKGRYTFANGTIYDGEFASGQFEGKGQYIFQGIGKVEATFADGRAVGEELTFDDGLQYKPQGWKYCVEGDRRFYHEVVDPRFGLTD